MIIELIQTYPKISIIVLSLIITLLITVVNFFMVDRNRMKEIRDKQKRLKEEIKKFGNNPEKISELNKQIMEDMPEQLKHSFKPMLVTLVPLLISFSLLKATYATTAIASSWIWWYIIASILFSIVLRKIFGLQ